MKVIQINTVVGSGSVGRITVGLYDTAVANQLQARVCYGRRQAPAAMGAHAYKNCHVFDCVSHVLRNFVIGDSGFGSVRATGRLLHFLEEEQADVIHLHNIHGFYLHVGMLFAYLKKKQVPVVWTLHDCWAMTGHCAYFDYVHCDKWKKGCFSCPQHRTSYPYALLRDNSLHNYAEKKAAFTGMPHLTIVTPSHWLAELVRQSYLKEYPEKVIYNGIDTEIFAPSAPILESAGACVDNSSARTHSYTVLGVANIWEKRKGLSYFEALAVSLPDDYHIIVVGVDPRQSRMLQKKEKQGILPKGKITAITRTDNMTALAELYRQADVYVNPTLEDNFPTTNLEALACGTPVVTFATGGSPEALDENTGIVVEQGNTEALTQAVCRIAEASSQGLTRYSTEACRNRALLFRQQDQFQKYIELYRTIAGQL